MKIVPNEVPDAGEAAVSALALAMDPLISVSETKVVQLKSLDGRNVFVQFKDGTSKAGFLNASCGDETFQLGWKETVHFYKDVDSVRLT